jgi:hypothetical protein
MAAGLFQPIRARNVIVPITQIQTRLAESLFQVCGHSFTTGALGVI